VDTAEDLEAPTQGHPVAPKGQINQLAVAVGKRKKQCLAKQPYQNMGYAIIKMLMKVHAVEVFV